MPFTFFFFNSTWQIANQFGWWTGLTAAPAEWKSIMMGSGEQFVTTDGACRKQLLHAGSWTVGMLSQSGTRPSSAEVGIRSGWTMSSALVMRNPLLTARTEVLENTTVTTMKMPVSYAQVTHPLLFCCSKMLIPLKYINEIRLVQILICAFVCHGDECIVISGKCWPFFSWMSVAATVDVSFISAVKSQLFPENYSEKLLPHFYFSFYFSKPRTMLENPPAACHNSPFCSSFLFFLWCKIPDTACHFHKINIFLKHF